MLIKIIFFIRPTLLMENEVSVYDLKDHPDFQYRPGTVVIRVANFQGEDEGCTAGQVLDNYPEGRVCHSFEIINISLVMHFPKNNTLNRFRHFYGIFCSIYL